MHCGHICLYSSITGLNDDYARSAPLSATAVRLHNSNTSQLQQFYCDTHTNIIQATRPSLDMSSSSSSSSCSTSSSSSCSSSNSCSRSGQKCVESRVMHLSGTSTVPPPQSCWAALQVVQSTWSVLFTCLFCPIINFGDDLIRKIYFELMQFCLKL